MKQMKNLINKIYLEKEMQGLIYEYLEINNFIIYKFNKLNYPKNWNYFVFSIFTIISESQFIEDYTNTELTIFANLRKEFKKNYIKEYKEILIFCKKLKNEVIKNNLQKN